MKRILAAILMLTMLVLPVLAVPENCEHELMHMRNDACHYDECTVCFELFNVGDHTMKDGVCTVCNYPETAPWDEEIAGEGEHEHIFNKTADEETHYEECTVCFERFGVGEHTFENGVCTVCGHNELVNPFNDVKDTAWYAGDVLSAVEMGLVSGKTEDEFRPDDNLTYAEAIKLAACMNQKYVDGVVTLKNGSPWYQSYVDYCKEKGIIRSDYKYDDYATRVGYMYIFALALPDEAYEPINNVPDGSIPDVPADAPYASVVYKLYRAGIVTGVDEARNCNPTANIKRSEVAVIIARMMDESKRVKFSLDGDAEPEAHEHDFQPIRNGRSHWEECFECGEYRNAEDHIFEDGVCKVCGYEEDGTTKPEDHEHDFQPIRNDKSHWEECFECGEYRNAEDHIFENGVCKVCGLEEKNDKKPEEKFEGKIEDTEVKYQHDSIVVGPENGAYEYENKYLTVDGEITGIFIEKQPVSIEVEAYTSPGTLEVKVNGGRRPYTYQWKYRQGRETFEVVDSNEVRGAQTDKLTIYTNPNNKYTGTSIYCTVTDADGNSVNSNAAAVYGPLAMKIEDYSIAGTEIYELVGRLSDGMLTPDEIVGIERNGKIIAIGIVKEITMFGKNLDVATKGDYCGITFRRDEGFTPTVGDTVLAYKDFFKVDGSDIVN